MCQTSCVLRTVHYRPQTSLLSFSDHVSKSGSVSPQHFHSCLSLNCIIILTQACMMTASIEMKSSESEAPLRGEMVKCTCLCPSVWLFPLSRLNSLTYDFDIWPWPWLGWSCRSKLSVKGRGQMPKIVFWHHCYLASMSRSKAGFKVKGQGQWSRSKIKVNFLTHSSRY